MSLPITLESRRRLLPGLEIGGKVRFGSPREAREFAARLPLEAGGADASSVAAGELNAVSQLEEIFQALISRYLERDNPTAFRRALERLEAQLGRRRLDDLLDRFAAIFSSESVPPGGANTAGESGAASAAGETRRERLLRDLLVLLLLDSDPAVPSGVRALWRSGGELPETAAVLDLLSGFFAGEPGFDGGPTDLIATIRQPIVEAPDDLGDQLRLALSLWGGLLGDLQRPILSGLDLIAEETAPRFPPGPGPPPPASFAPPAAEDRERYSPDVDWMPGLVLVAKNAYVWLDQLSRRHGRPIRRLDEIPGSELDTLAAQGFTGLWLIGVWERSAASERIKRLCGNSEAAASAYALVDYAIAEALGGEEALRRLEAAALRRGIRLAADMVPNHMGIDSRWVLDHPERFLSVDECPFPSYTFDGPDLSPRSDVGIYLEDHYYDRSDAAVVFKRVDRRTGKVRFIYHGNDGTSTPWNDTAQLNYLQPEVREAVTATILRVARRFPIIRFDAAMTLARKHIRRLWFPEAGSGGAIPSRAEAALPQEKFDRLMPEEFWRQVVDRIAAEAPDTLLLAEAFWLMESYFVRTLGMHRVYNSAFMNMLRDGRNADYRTLLRQTSDYDPRILQRYVNFMSNPDEATAAEQFGRGDRYFGTCAVMATMPGLPMFAHGQMEGLAEKYGMEYRRSYRNEAPDAEVLARHAREISPLLRNRGLFAAVNGFTLLDFVDGAGRVRDNVLAFGNGNERGRILIAFNNAAEPVTGQVDLSGAKRLAATLGLPAGGEGMFLRFYDRIAGREYLRGGAELERRGLAMGLSSFECRVLDGFRWVEDDSLASYRRLAEELGDRGVPSLAEALRDLDLQPVRWLLSAVLNPPVFARIAGAAARGDEAESQEVVGDLAASLVGVGRELAKLLGGAPAERELEEGAKNWAAALLELPSIGEQRHWPPTRRFAEATRFFKSALEIDAALWGALWSAAVLDLLRSTAGWQPEAMGAARVVADALGETARERPRRGAPTADLVGLALDRSWLLPQAPPGRRELVGWVRESLAEAVPRRLTGLNQAGGFDWWGGEEIDTLLQARFAFAAVGWLASPEAGDQERAEGSAGWCDALARIRALVQRKVYRLDRISAAAEPSSATKSASE